MSQLVSDPPKILYKFRSEFTRDIKHLLIDRQLYLPPPHTLNDPFDCYPSIEIPPPSEYQRIVDLMLKECPPDEHDEVIKRCKLLFSSPIHRQSFLDEFYKNDLGSLGVASLSACRDHPLLWAHYGGNFSGFAVGYRAQDEDGFEAIPAIPVAYVPERPKLSPFLGSNWLDVLFTKSLHWSYEEEWRYVRMPNDGGHGPFEVPRNSILEVCLGPRITPEDRSAVISAASELDDKPKIYDVKLKTDVYGFFFDLVNE